MQPASFGAVSRPSAAMTRSRMKETKMRAYSLSELFNLTRAELFALHSRVVGELPTLPVTDRPTALEILRKIRRVLARKGPAP
jgi:hypothetical protein